MIKIQATCLNMKYFFSVDGWNCKKVLCPSCVKGGEKMEFKLRALQSPLTSASKFVVENYAK